MKISKLLQTLLIYFSCTALAESEIEEDYPDEPGFLPIEDCYLDFPMMRNDFKLWDSKGTAVFLKNKAIIAPEASNTKGMIHTKNFNTVKQWITDVNFSIGRDKV